MRQDLTDHRVYKELTGEGVPAQVAIRAAMLVGGRDHLYVDHATRLPLDPATGMPTVDHEAKEHEVVIITTNRVIHVLGLEATPDQRLQHGRKYAYVTASVWSRNRLCQVDAFGDESAWENLIAGKDESVVTGPGPMRKYSLDFEGAINPVTIPLSRVKQNEADQIASCLAFEVK